MTMVIILQKLNIPKVIFPKNDFLLFYQFWVISSQIKQNATWWHHDIALPEMDEIQFYRQSCAYSNITIISDSYISLNKEYIYSNCHMFEPVIMNE